jgi:hypothetical protein
MAAREQLMGIFRAAIEETRGLLQQGQQVPGVLANMISAVDEEGNRWGRVCVLLVSAFAASVVLRGSVPRATYT